MSTRPAPTPAASKAAALDGAAVIADIEALLATEIFSAAESHGPLFRAAFAWLILNVHDLLQDLDRAGTRITQVPGSDEDMTDLIGRVRYAIVHSAAGARKRGGRGDAATARFAVSIGIASGFADDIAVETGGVRVLVRRHAVRAFEAARAAVEAR